MNSEMPQDSANSVGRSYIWTLGLAYFATVTLDLFLSFLLIDISATFNTSLGAVSQASFFSSIAAIITGLLMTFLSFKFRQKSLILAGLVCMLISGIGTFSAPTLYWLYFSYSFQGVSSIIVLSMALSLVGDNYPARDRAKKVSYIVTAAPISNIIAIIFTGVIATNFGWRFVPLLFSIPTSIIALVLVYLIIPNYSRKSSENGVSTSYFTRIKSVLLNRSVSACLVGNTLRTAAYMAIVLFGISFYRQTFSMPMGQAIYLMLGGLLSFTIGTLVSGNIANRFGKRSTTIFSVFMAGLFVIILFQMTSFWRAIPFDYSALFFSGLANSASTAHTLDQAPKARPTLMSLNSTFIILGMAIVPAIGGLILDTFSFQGMGLALGFMGFVAALIFSLTKEK